MKIQLDHEVMTPTGNPIKMDDAKPPKTLKVRDVLENALAMPLEDDLRHGTQRFVKLGDLLKKLSDAKGEVELESEDITLIKERIPRCFNGNPLVVWGALRAAEGMLNESSTPDSK